jgi:hypothetical protein
LLQHWPSKARNALELSALALGQTIADSCLISIVVAAAFNSAEGGGISCCTLLYYVAYSAISLITHDSLPNVTMCSRNAFDMHVMLTHL